MKSALVGTLALLGTASADVTFSRKIDQIADYAHASAVLSGCPAVDAYGSNNCDIKWGAQESVTYNVSLTKPITQGATIDVDLKASFLPLKFSCAACGDTCKFKVPIIGKEVSIKLPDCPIKAQGLANTAKFSLPSKSPLPLDVKLTGSITVTNGDKSVVVKAEVDVDAGKEEQQEDLEVYELDWSHAFE